MSIPANIRQLADNVRSKVYGKDVRESIARSMEESGRTSAESNARSINTEERQDHVETRYDVAVGAHTEDSEILDARVDMNAVTYENLSKRLAADYMSQIEEIRTISLNVKSFGALGDGVTDDYNAIQETLDAAPEYSEILIPPGSFIISDYLLPKEGQKIRFHGELILKNTNDFVTCMIRVEYPNITLIEPRLDMDRLNNRQSEMGGTQAVIMNYGNGVNLKVIGGVVSNGIDNLFQGGRTGLRIIGTLFDGAGDHGFYFNGISSSSSPNPFYHHDIIIDGVRLLNVGLNQGSSQEGHITQTRFMKNIKILNSYFDYGDSTRITMGHTFTDCEEVVLKNNYSTVNDLAYQFNRVKNYRVESCDAKGNHTSFMRDRDSTGGKIINSYFYGFGSSEIVAPYIFNCEFHEMYYLILVNRYTKYKNCKFYVGGVERIARLIDDVADFIDCDFYGMPEAPIGIQQSHTSNATDKRMTIKGCTFHDYTDNDAIVLSSGNSHKIVDNDFPKARGVRVINAGWTGDIAGTTLIADNYIPLGKIRVSQGTKSILRDNILET